MDDVSEGHCMLIDILGQMYVFIVRIYVHVNVTVIFLFVIVVYVYVFTHFAVFALQFCNFEVGFILSFLQTTYVFMHLTEHVKTGLIC